MNPSLVYHPIQDKENHYSKRNLINSIKNVKDKVLGRSIDKMYLSVSMNEGHIKKIMNKVSFKEKTNDSQFITEYGHKVVE